MNTYQQKAHNTKARRQAIGYYATLAHQAAFAKLMRRGGERNLTQEDAVTLSTHPLLTVTQREHFAWLATTK